MYQRYTNISVAFGWMGIIVSVVDALAVQRDQSFVNVVAFAIVMGVMLAVFGVFRALARIPAMITLYRLSAGVSPAILAVLWAHDAWTQGDALLWVAAVMFGFAAYYGFRAFVAEPVPQV